MTDDQQTYLAVLKAAFDYDPQPDAEDEIPIKENQVLLLLERVDEDWWKVKVRQDEDGAVGLVPSTYLEPQEHISVVKAQYDYDAQQLGELTVKEDEVLYVYDKDDAWLLVHSQRTGGRVGFVPENYVEEISEDSEDATAAPEALPVSQIIVPPSPPRPSAPYVDPEVLVAATANKSKADNIQTWAVSEVDKKGKKKKGTLGVGNGTVFFASESDKTPVQQWQTSFLQSAHIDKTKHVMIEVGGPSPINLHFHAGSKDNAEAIIAKLKLSKELSLSSSESAAVADVPERPRSAAKSVHFDAAPAFIPPREPSEDGEDEDSHPNAAVVLYDFTADGDDELNVQQGESLIVLDWDADDWWKVRNSEGLEGVVPANYVELNPAAVFRRETDAQDVRKSAEETAAAERRAEDAAAAAAAKQQQKEASAQRAKAAAAAAEADKKRRDAERAAQEKVAEEQRDRDRHERELARRVAANEGQISALSERRSSANGRSSTSSNSASRGPPPDNTRIWRDRSGQFSVDAKFLGFSNGKLRLHKTNGVVIEVPSEKMSPEDIRYVEKLTNKGDSTSSSPVSRVSEDDEPLASRRRSLREDPKPPAKKKSPQTDWFEFFLSAGCDVDDCTRYASSFERDKIDESILPDITEGTMRSLGLREGDIIRVKKEIDKRNPKEDKPASENPAPNILAGPTPPPNLFAQPNGVLKNNTQRRGRPTPSKSLPPPGNVDITAISSASEQIQRTGSPLLINPGTPVQPPPRSSSVALSAPTGFDDDAWTNRPSSARPSTQTPPIATNTAMTARAPSAPPTTAVTPVPPPIPASSLPTVAAQSAPIQLQSQSTGGKGLAQTTESDVFEQLARLSQLRVQSPAVSPPVTSRLNGSLAPVASPPPRFSSGMGMGPSPVPMGNLQAQSSAALQQQNGLRGSFTPVPNQPLLQPLIPTTTGFSGFVPTRPSSNSSSFQPQQQNFLSSQPTGFPGPVMSNPTGFQLPLSPQGPQQPSGLQTSNFLSSGFQQSRIQSQPTGFQPQPTGFQPQLPGFQPQPSGFQPSGNNMFQPTGAQGTNGFGSSPFQPTNNNTFGQVQPNPTGFNAGGFGQSPFGNHMAVPPVPPLPQSNSNSNNTAPANVFAQMKAGTFANNDSTAQSAANYDALRPNPLTVQATGWNPGPSSYGSF